MDDLLDGIDFDYIDSLEQNEKTNNNTSKRICLQPKSEFKRPTIIYGCVNDYSKEYDANNPNRFDVVLRITILSHTQKAYLDNEESIISDETHFTVVLQDEWTSTIIHPNDYINVIILTPGTFNSCVYVSNKNHNYIITSPDCLFISTNIASSYTCLRKSVLSNYIKTYQETKYSLFGRMRHALIETTTFLLRQPSIINAALPEQINQCIQLLHSKILELLKQNIDSIYMNSIDIKEAYEALHFSIPGVLQWFYICFESISKTKMPNVSLSYHNQPISIVALEDTEETLWCPEWGLKGILDMVCDVNLNGNIIKIPVEIKTGSEDPIAHDAQLSLYSVILSQFNTQSDFTLIQDHCLSGLLVYLKSNAIPFKEYNSQQCYNEIKEEFMHGQRGDYITNLLNAVSMQCHVMFSPHNNSKYTRKMNNLVIREKELIELHVRGMLMRRNLLSSYVDDEKKRKRRNIQKVETGELEIEDMYQLPLLPDACGNTYYCEKCSLLPFCAILSKIKSNTLQENIPSLAASVESSNNVITSYASSLSPSAIDYFNRWFSLIQIERLDSKHKNDAIWSSSSKQRQQDGLTILQAKLLFMQDCSTFKSHHTHKFKDICIDCSNQVGFRYCFELISPENTTEEQNQLRERYISSFTESDSVIISSQTGRWGLAYATVNILLYSNNIPLYQENASLHSLTSSSSDQRIWIILSSPNCISLPYNQSPLNQFYRIDKYSSFDLSLSAVNNLVTFVAHKQAELSVSQPLNTFFSQQGADKNQNNMTMIFPSLRRLRDIIIDNDLPQMKETYHSIDELIQSVKCEELSEEDELMLLLDQVETNQSSLSHDLKVHLFKIVQDLIKTCNSDQIQAILKCFNSNDICLIQGLPGTGKTTIITIIIIISLLQEKRILLSSHTHTAIDNVLVKLIPYNTSSFQIPILRLGEQSRIHPMVRRYHISYQWSGSFDDYIHIMNNSMIVAATVYTSISQFPRGIIYDRCIIDEAGQITEPDILQVMMLSKKTLLVGDSMQLPPLVQSKASLEGGLNESLLSRLQKKYDELPEITKENDFVSRLSIQYRMNDAIMSLANHLIYNNCLKAANARVANARLQLSSSLYPKQWIKEVLDMVHSVVFINTDCDLETHFESEAKHTSSRNNEFEATIVYHLVQSLINNGMVCNDIGVISPYSAQVVLMMNKLSSFCRPHQVHNKDTSSTVCYLEVSTVDKFQGRDKECIIVSLVRNNVEQNVGSLLQDWRRVNVAFTRAKKKLIIIGSEHTLCRAEIWQKCLQFLHESCKVINVTTTDLYY